MHTYTIMHYYNDPNPSILKKQPHTYRIMTYNVHGFTDAKHTKRIDDIINIINLINPDILILEEVFVYKRNETISEKRLVQLLKPLKLTHYIFSANGSNAVFSKHQFRAHEIDLGKDTIKRIPRNALLCDFESFIVIGTHLDVFDETGVLRMQQMNLILSAVPQGQKCIVCGDFNSLRKADYLADEWNALIKIDADRGVLTIEDVVPLIEEAGFRDSFDFCGTSLKVSVWSERRVDYIFGHDVFFVQSNVMKVTASDHYPVYADFIV